MSSRLHHVMVALVFSAWAGCYLPDDEQELTAETASPLVSTQTLSGYESNVGAPASWWHDTGIDIVTLHYRARFAASIPGCYEVSTTQDTHVHFELGTRKDTMGTGNSACWARYSRTTLREPSAKLGQYGLTGFATARQCP